MRNRPLKTGIGRSSRALAASLLLASASLSSGHAQTLAPDPNAAAIAALQTYELPDQTASVRLPSSWRVTSTGVGFVQAQGPNGELALFGVMVPAKNGAALNISPAGLVQPFNADPEQKFLASINWVRQRNGKPSVQAQFYSKDPVSAPAAFGTCTNITAILAGSAAVETDFCSLPMDASGAYRNFFKVVGLPAQSAKQERSLMEAILASYRLNIQAVQKQQAAAKSSAPATASAPKAGASLASAVSAQNSLLAGQLMIAQANAINSATFAGMRASDASVSNFDHGVLRGQTPIYAAGVPQPVFWVGN
jgi:hypothetical protein